MVPDDTGQRGGEAALSVVLLFLLVLLLMVVALAVMVKVVGLRP